ncbi:hypothetical protein D7B24_006599 [Verticillium nonalfalfae]|uniref:Uncharacterized protein n=1 Tax=Verticillium nonalfalfae TaxID=1051616 RepID=A0A3M9Y8X7_9PEZI|nr:uncharacterized protein D7B24_006599 [Verticillium nonalfalfae]RNJ56953.1 hypothetical protein D7B24_006599 [Verticillium nonalfalfae]
MSPSQDIVPAGSSFAQQGSMDWVGLSSRSVHFTMDVLSRFMAAGVQPFTIVVGQEVARHLPLAESGQRNVQDALNQLASYQSIGSVLWFGFGLRGLARTLGATAEGRSLLALCAALGESFHEDYAASVLHHLVLAYQPPSGFVPSLHEWQQLVKACNGILSQSKFPILVDAFVRLVPRRRRLQEALESRRSGFFLETECPSPKDMAGALLALGMLRRGQYAFVTVEGGLGSGWLAAMAEWMYDLGVGISDAQGNTIYRSPGPGGDLRPHLLIRLSKQTVDVRHVGASPAQDLTLASKTYYLRDKLGIAKLLCIEGTPFSGGRLSWHECLGEAYGLEFAELMRASDLVGCAFGCAARIFSGIMAFEQPGMDIYHAVQTRNYFEESGGRGFIRFSVRRFPELAPLTRRSYEQLALSFQAAQVMYIQSLFDIRKLCACNICSGSGSRPSLDSLCLLAVFESVVIVCQMLSGMEVADGMGLRRDGLEWVYHNAHNALVDSPKRVGSPGQALLRQTETARIITCSTQGQLAESAMMLFGGRKAGSSSNVSALSSGGVCVFYSILRDFTLDREALGRVHVVGGHIDLEGALYDRIQDATGSPVISQDHPGWPFWAVSLAITQRIGSLQVDFALADQARLSHDTPLIGPAYLVETALRARGAVHCYRSASRCHDPSLATSVRPSRPGFLLFSDAWEVVITKTNDPKDTTTRGGGGGGPADPQAPLPLLSDDGGTQTMQAFMLAPSVRSDVARAVTLVTARSKNCLTVLCDYQCLACCSSAAMSRAKDRNWFAILPCDHGSTAGLADAPPRVV